MGVNKRTVSFFKLGCSDVPILIKKRNREGNRKPAKAGRSVCTQLCKVGGWRQSRKGMTPSDCQQPCQSARPAACRTGWGRASPLSAGVPDGLLLSLSPCPHARGTQAACSQGPFVSTEVTLGVAEPNPKTLRLPLGRRGPVHLLTVQRGHFGVFCHSDDVGILLPRVERF